MSKISAAAIRGRFWSKGRIRHMQLLVQVAELGSIHKAAAVVGMTQPGVTQQIAELERLLETSLFLRHAKGVKLTEAGRDLLPLAKRILNSVDEVADQVAALTDQYRGVVRIAASQGGMSAVLAEAIPRFNAIAPAIAIRVRESDPASIVSLLAQREVDLGVFRSPEVIPQGWYFAPLHDDRLIVVAGAQHTLTRRKSLIKLEELRRQHWLALPVDSRARQAFDEAFAGGHPVLSRVSARAPAVLWSMLTSLDLLVMVPESLVSQFLGAGILKEIRTELDLPLAPLGLLRPAEGGGVAAEQFAAFLLERHRPPPRARRPTSPSVAP